MAMLTLLIFSHKILAIGRAPNYSESVLALLQVGLGLLKPDGCVCIDLHIEVNIWGVFVGFLFVCF